MATFKLDLDQSTDLDQPTTLTITAPIKLPGKPSTSGKSLVIFTTHGNVVTDSDIAGQSIVVNCTVYYKNPNKD